MSSGFEASYPALQSAARAIESDADDTDTEAKALKGATITSGNVGEHYARYGTQISLGLRDLAEAVRCMGVAETTMATRLRKTLASYQAADQGAKSDLYDASGGY